MNKFSFILITCALCFFGLFSCKKETSSPKAHTIVYKLSGSNYAFFKSVSYTDSVGAQAVVSAVDSSAGWSKTIKESYVTFPATLQVQGLNLSSTTLTYTVEILVDGISKAKQEESIIEYSNFNTQIAATVEF